MRKILFTAIFVFTLISSHPQVQQVWTVPFNYSGASDDVATVNALDPSGNVYVAGINRVEYTNAFFSIIKYDKNGNLIWRRSHGGGDYYFNTHPVAMKIQGNYIYVMATNYTYLSIYFVCKYDLNGNLIWQRLMTTISASEWGGQGADMDVDVSGNVFVTGFIYREESAGAEERFSDYFTIKHDAATGNPIWGRTFNGADPGNGINRPSSIIVDGAGNAYITGRSTLNGQMDIVTIKYAPDGSRLWAERYEGLANDDDGGRDITLDANNNVIVVGFVSNISVSGYQFDLNQNYDMITIKYNNDGNLLWAQTINGAGNNLDEARKVIIDGNNNIITTGTTFNVLTTVKYNPTGAVLWMSVYRQKPNDPGSPDNLNEPYSIALDQENNIYIAARRWSAAITTVKYNSSNGSLAWAKIFEPEGSTSFSSFAPEVSVAVDANYNVYVCGSWDPYPSAEDESDFITIRYSQCNIVCPSNITINADPGKCDAVVTFADVTTTGDCGSTLAYSHASGSTFPVGTTTVTVSSDATGASCSFTITVVDNVNPVITCPGNKTVNTDQGVCYASSGSVNAGVASASDACNPVGVVGVRSDGASLGANYPVGVTIIKWTATDANNNTSTCTQTITVVDNVPPTISAESASTYVLSPPNHTMRDVTVYYTATDNCAVTATIAVTSNEPINGVGDGDTDPDWVIVDNVPGSAGQYVSHLQLRAERAAGGNGRVYTITITAIDPSGNTNTKIIEVKVPHDIKKPHSGQPFIVGSTVNFEGEFWDKPGNKHTAKWLIDGSTTVKATVTEPAGNKNGKVTGSYKFTVPGVYKLQMNVTDQTGITHYSNTAGDLEAIVVIYDPNGGHAYGGGYYNSPAGALTSNPFAMGKASYGFAMNYFKNSTYPKGETQFEFKVGDFEFNALNFEYLVISNSMAQFKGTGKIIGGQSGVGFTMTVADGQLDGTGVDKIRMKIYNKNNGTIIYDNQPGASDAALPTQPVGANSIIVISGANSNMTKSNTTQIAERESAAEKTATRLNAIAYPNPSTNNFSVVVQAEAKNKIVMQILDILGRVIETRNITAGSVIKFGDNYRPGTYFIRIAQGRQHKELKLVKISD